MGSSRASREHYNIKRREKRRLLREGILIEFPRSQELTAEEIIEQQERQYATLAEAQDDRHLLHIKRGDLSPIGIVHLGDPHLDDNGTDWPQLKADLATIKATPGLYAANIGDTTNNWAGRLAHLYSRQTTSAAQGWILTEWLFQQLMGKWIYILAGNHGAWSGDGDPAAWIARQVGAIYEKFSSRVAIDFPNGKSIVINARHDFPGGSQWNAAHGQAKNAMLGVRDDIHIAGHKHISGYNVVKDPSDGKLCHCIQVGTYKRYDRYAEERGFRDQMISSSVTTVINPRATDPRDLIQVFWSAQTASEFLRWLRKGKRLDHGPSKK
jgi:hypothetical protein